LNGVQSRRLVLEMTIDGASYAVPLSRVLEVLLRVWLTPLPDAPRHVVGAFAYRGKVAAAFDAAQRLGHPERAARLADHLVVTQGQRFPIALIADRVVGVRELEPETIVAPPVPSPTLRGVVARRDGLLLLEDLDALMSSEEEQATELGLRSLSS
jgi:chemotaxis signal transduction protein